MRRRHLLPAGTVFMALVIALGGLGVAYGLWTDMLEVNGTVTTGEVDAQMTLGEIDQGTYLNGDSACDTDTDASDDCEPPLENDKYKDVGECTARLTTQSVPEPAITGSGSAEGDGSADKVEITVTNAYPGYKCFVEIDVKNIGSIPIKVDPPVVTSTATGGDPSPNVTVGTAGCWTGGLQLHTGDDSAVVSTTLPTAYPECRVTIEVNQGASEETTYTFLGTFFADQWNEYTAGN